MTPYQTDVLVAQLLAARAQIDATLAVLGIPEELAPDVVPECTHPADQREELTTMGGPTEWRCRLCGHHSITPIEG